MGGIEGGGGGGSGREGGGRGGGGLGFIQSKSSERVGGGGGGDVGGGGGGDVERKRLWVRSPNCSSSNALAASSVCSWIDADLFLGEDRSLFLVN